MEARRFRSATTRNDELDYWLYQPLSHSGSTEATGATADGLLPLVIFLHGAGERGDDLERVASHGPPRQVADGRQLPFVMIAPQCPADSWWNWHQEALIALLDELLGTLPIDPDRVYLTGLSMGGMGTWDLAARHPERFAAIVPICGSAGRWMAGRLVQTPIWAFHNSDDPVVPVSGTTGIVEALEANGGKVRATINPTGGHDAWTAAYDDPALYDWLLAQRGTGPVRPVDDAAQAD